MFSYIGIILATLEMHATSSKRLSYIANTIVHAKKTCAKYIAILYLSKQLSYIKTDLRYKNIQFDL